jgi:hypothetical protein
MKHAFSRRDSHFKFVGHDELRVCLKIAPITKICNQQTRCVEASCPKIAAIAKFVISADTLMACVLK